MCGSLVWIHQVFNCLRISQLCTVNKLQVCTAGAGEAGVRRSVLTDLHPGRICPPQPVPPLYTPAFTQGPEEICHIRRPLASRHPGRAQGSGVERMEPVERSAGPGAGGGLIWWEMGSRASSRSSTWSRGQTARERQASGHIWPVDILCASLRNFCVRC